MTSGRDTVSARLRRIFEEWNSYEFRKRRKAALRASGKRDFSDEAIWAETAREAFGFARRVEGVPDEYPICQDEEKLLIDAFWTFDLDPADPRDCRALLDILVRVVAPELSALCRERKVVGAPTKWNTVRRIELAVTVEKLKRDAKTRISDRDACDQLKSAPDSPPHIKATASPDALVRQLVEGRRLLRRQRRPVDEPSFPVGLWRKIASD